MSYIVLETISSSFSRAVGNTSGLNDYYMVDESEVNQIRNISYPCLIVEVPNSSVLSINRAYEEYQMSCFVLYKYDSTKDFAAQVGVYDQAIQKLESVITNMLLQRNGKFIVESDSFEIERLKNFGSDKSIGIKCEFTLLAPSNLGNFTERSTLDDNIVFPLTTNLISLFHGGNNVNRTNSSLSWLSSVNGAGVSQQTITHFNGSDVPEYSSPTFTFSTSNSEGMVLDGLNFSSANFCVVFRLSINYPNTPDHTTIFDLYEASTGDGLRLGAQSGVSTEGRAFVMLDEDDDGVDETAGNTYVYFNEDINELDINPLSECSLAFVNDATNNEMYLKILPNDSTTVETHKLTNQSHSNQFLNAKMTIGMADLRPYNFGYRGLAGTVSHIAIYDSALTDSDVDEVLIDIKEL
tara:strand:- start:142 stop:1368 length:1227 start_codon:yes stop_codon:yes gene_type:complete